MKESLKQVILCRMDLKMEKGKLSVQVAHASVEAVLGSSKEKVHEWYEQGMKKVTLKVTDLKELQKYQREAQKQGIKTAIITDAGKTFFDKPTITCVAIGPDREEKIDRVTGHLKIL